MHTGALLSQRYVGAQPALTCPATGVTSTAAVGFSPRGHIPTVYVAGGDGYLYALRASNLSLEWQAVVGIPSKTINDYYNWSSPMISHGKIYLGISSNCDIPLIRGGVVVYSQATGRRLAVYYTVPAGAKNAGGSVWSSIGIGPNGDVYATTGNGPANAPRLQNSESIIKLDPNTLKLLGSYKVPQRQVTSDGDFGGSPVFFGKYVGACNKNGYFYVLNQTTMKLVWRWRIGVSSGGPKRGECLASPAYNGKELFFGGNETTFDKTTYPGSVSARSATTGALLWQTGLPGGVMGSPTLDGGGLIAVGTFSAAPNGVYLSMPAPARSSSTRLPPGVRSRSRSSLTVGCSLRPPAALLPGACRCRRHPNAGRGGSGKHLQVCRYILFLRKRGLRLVGAATMSR